MLKRDLVKKIADKSGFTQKDSHKALDAVLEVIQEELANGKEVKLTGFGKFYLSAKGKHVKKIPYLNTTKEIPAKASPRFKAGKNLREAVRENVIVNEQGDIIGSKLAD